MADVHVLERLPWQRGTKRFPSYHLQHHQHSTTHHQFLLAY